MSETTDVVKSEVMFGNDAFRSIQTLDDALALVREAGIEVRKAADEIGDGFVLLENKDDLLKVPFIVMSYIEADGDFGEKYAIMRVVSARGKHVVTDGGTGIKAQMQEYIAQGGNPVGLLVEGGLRKSEYQNEHTDHGVTYYLAV